MTFFSRASALVVRLICAAFGLEKNDASQLLFTSLHHAFHGAAKACELVFQLMISPGEPSYKAYNGETLRT